jgi:hypothetical protein
MVHSRNIDSVAQGTIEYLVVVATIIVIALIAISLFVTLSSAPSQQVINSSNKTGNISTGGISIVDAVIDSDGNSLILLNNNSSDSITLKKISVDDVENIYNDVIPGLGSNPINLKGLSEKCPCGNGQKTVKCEYKFEYLTETGITKIDKRTINLQCITGSVSTSGGKKVIGPIVDEGDEIIFGTCGSISTPAGYTVISSCTDIILGGNYILTNNLDCSLNDLTIAHDDVNINGNYCTITGNINASASGNGVNAFTGLKINLTNIIGSIESNGSNGTGSGGNGGTVSLIDSNLTGTITSNGGVGDTDYDSEGSCGSGGNISLEGSIVGSIYSAGGSSGGGEAYSDVDAGFSGSVSLLNSNVNSIELIGGSTNNGNGGGSGSIDSTNSTIGTITSTGGSDHFSDIVQGGRAGGSGLINLDDSHVTSVVSIGGSNYTDPYYPGALSGQVFVSNSTVGSITAVGGYGANYGGETGVINISNSSIITSLTCTGGQGGMNGGDTNPIILADSQLNSVSSTGGLGVSTGGNVGDITLENISGLTSVSGAGGAGDWGNYGTGGNGGNIIFTVDDVPSCPVAGLEINYLGGYGYFYGSDGTVNPVDCGYQIFERPA